MFKYINWTHHAHKQIANKRVNKVTNITMLMTSMCLYPLKTFKFLELNPSTTIQKNWKRKH